MLQKLLGFARMLNELQAVERVIRVKNADRWENDMEHSYHLAMLAWYIIDSQQLALDREKVLRYALAHDLVEVYAGDTDAFDDKNKIANKKENEQKALETLKTDFPNFKELPQIIEKYEKQSDIEAQLVYVMDKFIADANIYYSAGDYYKSRKIDQKIWKKWLLSKIDLSKINPKLNFLVSESIEEIETKFRAMFYEVE
jgi:putative hydrolase of HD superfamily